MPEGNRNVTKTVYAQKIKTISKQPDKYHYQGRRNKNPALLFLFWLFLFNLFNSAIFLPSNHDF